MRSTAWLQVDVAYPNQSHSALANGRLDRPGLASSSSSVIMLARL
jgi:hypothetical protein